LNVVNTEKDACLLEHLEKDRENYNEGAFIMKIVAILSSPRRDQSSTNLLVNLALETAKNDGAEIDVVDITQLNIKYCVGCGVCWEKGKCCLPDDLQIVLDKIREADGVLFSSPVYVHNMTAQLKTLLDRMSSPLHCRFLDGKYVSSVVTTGSGGDDTVIAMIDEFAIQCGAAILNGVGAAFINPGAFDKAKTQSAILGKESKTTGIAGGLKKPP
jgi:multimeric flavodoxin WrbA